MKPKASVKHRFVDKFIADMKRAMKLYVQFRDRVVGQEADGATNPLMQHDRRDLAALIFLEAASQFEAFSYQCFEFTVRRHYRVNRTRAEYIMGSSDRGTDNVYGWASPETLAKRGFNVFGRKRFFGRLNTRIGRALQEKMWQAHTVRNRIAHSGSEAPKQYHKLLQKLGIPKRQRSGLSAGRLLLEYPSGTLPDKRLFFGYIRAYMKYAEQFRKHG